MSDGSDPEKLRALGEKLEELEAARKGPPRSPGKVEQANWAWHMVIELVVGMATGLGIGWGLDSLFGTMPIFLMIFGLFGFAAGIKAMLETAKKMQERFKAERMGKEG